MYSYDIFDTIIGRLCYHGKDIFDIIERKTKLKDFKEKRILFESTTKDFDETYKKLEIHYNTNLNHIKEYEIKLEYEMSFPIVKYFDQIKDTDFLISDMYLYESSIKNMLWKYKKINNKMHISYADKKNNIIWKNKTFCSNIKCHYGDNKISDYKNPISHGLKSVHITDTKLSQLENEVLKVNKYIAYIIRAVRLSYNDTSPNHIQNVFMDFALPFLILTCLKIKEICLKNNINNVVFLSRDGYWFNIMYKILFPDEKTNYVYFSRLYVNQNKTKVIKQINDIKGSKFVFDLQGSGRTFMSLNLTNCMYFMCFLSHDSKIKHFLYKHTHDTRIIKTVIEDIFIAPHGSVYTFEDHKNEIVLMQPEFDNKIHKIYFEGINTFQRYLATIKKYFIININFTQLDTTLSSIHNLVDQNYIANTIKKVINHINDHGSNNMGFKQCSLQYFSQIGQDKYYIENIIKFKPFGFFIEIGGFDGITGSNTYFLEKNLKWDGIVVECNPTLSLKCKKNRSCHVCDKALHEKDDLDVIFTIPKGDDIIGGKEQLGGIKSFLKPESLTAFQRCYKQSDDITVRTININTLLVSREIYNIDYVSLDVEGGELSILKTWNFNKHKVKFLTVEHGNIAHYQKSINQLLISKGFQLHRNNKWDDEYIFVSN